MSEVVTPEGHDPDKCFRCRLFKLVDELTTNELNGDDAHSILEALAEIAGLTLAMLDDKDMLIFYGLIMKEREEVCKFAEEERKAVRH